MRSSLIKSCLLALASASTVVAQIAGFDVFTKPSTPGSSIPAGQKYTIKWTPSAPAGKVSIYLLEGSSNTTLQIGPKIATSIDSVTGSYDWAVPSTGLAAFPYFGFKLALDSDPMTFQYSTYFTITGLAASTTSSGTVSTTTVASSSVTVVVSQVSATTSASTTTISASLVTVNSTASSSSTPAGIFPNSTITTTTSKAPATGTASTTSASATSSSGASGSIIVGGTSMIGAFFIALGMLL